ncbi:MAG: hypothetical protein PVG98_04830 [Chromatiales bacterium]
MKTGRTLGSPVAIAVVALALAGCALSPTSEAPSSGPETGRPVAGVSEVDRYARCLLAGAPPAGGCAGFAQDADPLALSRVIEERAREAMQAIYGGGASQAWPRMAGRYLIRLHADVGNCFDDLHTAGRQRALLRQVDEVALFLADYHARVLGAPGLSVLAPTLVEICSTRLGPEALYWSGPNTLEVRMPAGPAAGRGSPEDGLVSHAQIARAWRRGDHHVEDLRLFTRPVNLRRVWPVVDPAGTIRSGLRKLIVRRSRALQARLAEQERRLHRLAGGEGRQAVLEARALKLVEAETGLPPERVRRLTAGRDPAGLIRSWRVAAGDPERLTGIAEDLGAGIHPCSPHRGTEEKKRLFGLVVVENVHDIYVCVGPSETAARDQPPVDEPALERDVLAVGLVVVSTADLVHVEASLEDEIRALLDRTHAVERATFLSVVGGRGAASGPGARASAAGAAGRPYRAAAPPGQARLSAAASSMRTLRSR